MINKNLRVFIILLLSCSLYHSHTMHENWTTHNVKEGWCKITFIFVLKRSTWCVRDDDSNVQTQGAWLTAVAAAVSRRSRETVRQFVDTHLTTVVVLSSQKDIYPPNATA